MLETSRVWTRALLDRLFPWEVKKWLIPGVVIRLALAPFLQFTYDPVVWFNTGNDMLAGLDPYRTRTYSYPPFWAFTYFLPLWIAARIGDPRGFGTRFHELDWSSLKLGFYSPTILSPLFLSSVKLPLILADLVVGTIIFRLLKPSSGFRAAKLGYIFWTLNPLIIWTSSIHGMFDVLPTLFTLVSLVFLSRAKYLPTGASLAVAVMYKLYGAYLIPFFAVLAWTDLGREPNLTVNLKPALCRVAKLTLGLLVPLLVFLPLLSIADVLHPVSVRLQYLSSVGGLSPWGLANVQGLDWVQTLVAAHIPEIQIMTSAMVFTVSFLLGIRLARTAQVSMPDLALRIAVIIVLSYLTLFTVNPQYFVWVLPFLAIVMFGKDMFKLRGVLLSLAGVTYQIALSSSLILAPLTYTGLGPAWITSVTSDSILSIELSVLAGLLGVVVYLSFLIPRYKTSPDLGRQTLAQGVAVQSRPNGGPSSRSRHISTHLFSLFLAFLLVSAILVQVPTPIQVQPSTINAFIVNGKLVLQSSFIVTTTQVPFDLTIVAGPLTSVSPDRNVYIYFDPAYPTFGNDLRGWVGIIDHLRAELQLRGYFGTISIVNATDLRRVMVQDVKSVIVIPSGVFPETVHNATFSMVRDWLSLGGTLVWIGGIIGYYSGHLGQPVTGPPGPGLGIEGEQRILGYPLVDKELNGSQRMSTVDTRTSSALNLAYSDVWVAPTVAALKSVGGSALGRLQNVSDTSRASISLIPVGSGSVILFGGPVSPQFTPDGEDVIAHDAAQLLALGHLDVELGLEYVTLRIQRFTTSTLVFNTSFNVTSFTIRGLVLVAFSNHDFSRIYWRTQLPIGN